MMFQQQETKPTPTEEPFCIDHQKQRQKVGMMSLPRFNVHSRPHMRKQSEKSICNCFNETPTSSTMLQSIVLLQDPEKLYLVSLANVLCKTP